MANTPLTPFRLEPHMLTLLDRLAARLKTTRAAVVRIAIMDMARRYRISD
jgi:predicted transcriptional regulator